MRGLWACVLAAGVAACGPLDGCFSPPTIDEAAKQGVISGTVLYEGPVPPSGRLAAGNVLLFVYAENAPPPPRGSGRPVTFAVVPRASLFPDENTQARLHSAAFSIPLVPPGRYTLSALLDVDGDFQPFALVRSAATRGDVGGGYVDTSASPPVFVPFNVKGGEETRGITVSLSASAASFPSDAPAFALVGTPAINAASTLPTRIRVRSLGSGEEAAAVAADALPSDGLPGIAVTFGDINGDGLADDSDGDGFGDVYPRFLLRRLDAQRADLLGDDSSLTTIPCVVDPSPLLGAWPAGVEGAQGLWVRELDILCLPVAVDARTSPPTVLPSMPPGDYALLAISALGQVWRVPNELGPPADPVGKGLTSTALPSQAQIVRVEAAEIPTGGVSGTVALGTQPTGPTWIFLFSADAPPPPAGEGRPVATARIPPEAYEQLETGYRAQFQIGHIPPGTYLLTGLQDQDRNFDARVEQLSQPTRDDLLAAPAGPIVVGAEVVAADLSVDSVVPVHPPVADAPEMPLVLGASVTAVPLAATPVHNALAQWTPEGARFLIASRAAPPSDSDGDGLLDLWPRAFLQRVQADPADSSGVASDRRVVIPAAVDPAPMAMALGDTARAPFTVPSLRLLVPRLAVDATDAAAPISLPTVPAGTYALTMLSSTGQFWRGGVADPDRAPVSYVTLDTPFPEVPPSTGTGLRIVVPASTAPPGAITGVVTVASAELHGPVYVFAFNVDALPPPDGAGSPAAVARVQPVQFSSGGLGLEAPYALGPLPTGTYVVRAVLDEDLNFSLLSTLRTSPTAGDMVGGHLASLQPPVLGMVTVGQGPVADIAVVIGASVPVGPPIFEVASHELDAPLRAPVALTLRSPSDGSPSIGPGGTVDVSAEERRFAVTLRDADGDGQPDDADGDGLPDLYPRILLQKLDASDPTLQTPASDVTRIPALLDPARYLPPLLGGAPAVIVDQLHALVLPLGLDAANARRALATGTYGVAALSTTGQAWQIPNMLSPSVAQAGGGVVSQGRALAVEAPVPDGSGRIEGALSYPSGTCGNVVVLARRAGGGVEQLLQSPATLVLLSPERDGSGACTSMPEGYALEGLGSGSYVIQGFVDVDGDFHPFISTMRGPTAGDVAGGHVDGMGALKPLNVDGNTLSDVTVVFGTVIPVERPAFRFADGAARASGTTNTPVRTSFVVSGGLDTPLANVDGMTNVFTTVTLTGATTVTWPLVLLARLDESDPRGLRLAEPLELMAGVVDQTQFMGPVGTRIDVDIAPVRVDGALQPLGAASAGRYAVVVVNQGNQSWQIPNELAPELSVNGVGFTGADGQGASWSVPPR